MALMPLVVLLPNMLREQLKFLNGIVKKLFIHLTQQVFFFVDRGQYDVCGKLPHKSPLSGKDHTDLP
jgi:hypothetical protein